MPADDYLRNNNEQSGGLPHSEIHGSKPIPGSPWLNAGYHVLHRLLLPRHPPNALIALDLIRKKKDLRLPGTRPFVARIPFASASHAYYSRMSMCLAARRLNAGGRLRGMDTLWLVYLTWTTPPLVLANHASPTRDAPTTLIISLNDVKRLLAKTASDRTSKPCQARLADHVGEVWWSLTDSNR